MRSVKVLLKKFKTTHNVKRFCIFDVRKTQTLKTNTMKSHLDKLSKITDNIQDLISDSRANTFTTEAQEDKFYFRYDWLVNKGMLLAAKYFTSEYEFESTDFADITCTTWSEILELKEAAI